MRVLIRMFTVGAIIDRPQTTANQKNGRPMVAPTNKFRHIIFSADFCYNVVTS